MISLDSNRMSEMLFDVEWDLAEKTAELIELLKTSSYPKDRYEKIESLLEKRFNILGAQVLLDDIEGDE